jgi:hypothetical protein
MNNHLETLAERAAKLDARLAPIIERGRKHLQARYKDTFTFMDVYPGNEAGALWLCVHIDHDYEWGRFDLRTRFGNIEPEGAIEALVDSCADVYELAYRPKANTEPQSQAVDIPY